MLDEIGQPRSLHRRDRRRAPAAASMATLVDAPVRMAPSANRPTARIRTGLRRVRSAARGDQGGLDGADVHQATDQTDLLVDDPREVSFRSSETTDPKTG